MTVGNSSPSSLKRECIHSPNVWAAGERQCTEEAGVRQAVSRRGTVVRLQPVAEHAGYKQPDMCAGAAMRVDAARTVSMLRQAQHNGLSAAGAPSSFCLSRNWAMTLASLASRAAFSSVSSCRQESKPLQPALR